jgi:hypothetical protein
MELLFLWLLFGLAAALIGRGRGRSGCAWFFIGFLAGPFGLIAALLPARNQTNRRQYRACPWCAEAIRREAVKCRYCGNPVNPEAESQRTKRCSQCAQMNPEHSRRCLKCGHLFA